MCEPGPCVRALCDSDALFQRSYLKLHTSHCSLHSSHLHFTPHTSSNLISSHLIWALLISALLISPHLISSHLSSKFFSTIFISSEHCSTFLISCGEEAGARNIVFFRVVAAAGDEGQLVWEVGAAAVALACGWFLHCVLHCAVVHVACSRRWWNPWLQIAVEWPHDCCHLLLPCASIQATWCRKTRYNGLQGL